MMKTVWRLRFSSPHKERCPLINAAILFIPPEKAGTRYMVRDYRKYFEPFDAFGQYLVLLYDIALIRLEKPIQFRSGVNGVGAVERVCLPKLNDHHVNEELRVRNAL